MLTTTDAVVLKSQRQGESSRIVTLYSAEYGLIKVIAKGARGAKSRFGAALEPFSELTIRFYKKATPGLYMLGKADLLRGNRRIISELERLDLAVEVVDVLLQTLHDEECDPALYEILSSAFSSMELAVSLEEAQSTVISYYHHFLKNTGFAFSLEGVKVGARLYFDPQRGSFSDATDSDDADAHLQRHMLLPESISAIRFFDSAPVSGAAVFLLSPRAWSNLHDLYRSLFRLHGLTRYQNRPRLS